MLALADSDFVTLADWRYAWRIEQFGRPVTELDRARIRCLSPSASQRVARLLSDIRTHGAFPFDKTMYPQVESFGLTPVDHQDKLEVESREVKKWLYRRGVPFSREVFLSYDSGSCVVTTWKILIRYWNLFYYPISDDLTVIDQSLDWCLLFFHEHELFWGSRKKRANQALQTTSVTRSGFGKVPDSDRQRRGV